jgi:cytochrome P450
VYTDLIEAFYYEDIVKGKQEVTPHFIEELINDFGHLYTAGTDTTSHNSQVILYFIVSHPQVLQKLRE